MEQITHGSGVHERNCSAPDMTDGRSRKNLHDLYRHCWKRKMVGPRSYALEEAKQELQTVEEDPSCPGL